MANEFSPESVSRRLGSRAMRRPITSLLLAVAAVSATASAAASQSSGKGFLFNQPAGSFSLRGGYAYALAGSDIFDEATTQLTLSKRDFSSLTFGGDISWSMKPRVDLVFDAEFSRASKDSEMREWEGTDDLPIVQSTNYRRVPLTVGLRYYLTDRGRSRRVAAVHCHAAQALYAARRAAGQGGGGGCR